MKLTFLKLPLFIKEGHAKAKYLNVYLFMPYLKLHQLFLLNFMCLNDRNMMFCVIEFIEQRDNKKLRQFQMSPYLQENKMQKSLFSFCNLFYYLVQTQTFSLTYIIELHPNFISFEFEQRQIIGMHQIQKKKIREKITMKSLMQYLFCYLQQKDVECER